MESTVIADLPFVPSLLKKVPWQIRAILLVALLGAALYAVAAQYLGWPVSADFSKILEYSAIPGLTPAIGNITVAKGDGREAYERGYAAAQQVVEALKDEAPQIVAPVEEVAQEAAPVVEKVEEVVTPAAVAQVAQAVETVVPTAAAPVAQVAAAVETAIPAATTVVNGVIGEPVVHVQ